MNRDNAWAPGSHDLNADGIARVLRAWGDYEGDEWVGGFVLEMADGRRLYVESCADGPSSGLHPCASILPVPDGSDLLKLPHKHSSELYGWVEDLPELGEYLKRLQSTGNH